MSFLADSVFLRKAGYLLGDRINSGSFSTIHCALQVSDADVVAVKIIDLKNCSSCFRNRFLPRELENVQSLDHPNIIKVHKIVRSEAKVYIIMEHAPTNLRRQIELRSYIPEDQARNWFRQLASALYYLHKRGVAHRDIKIENILVDSRGQIKLCDFGLSKAMDVATGNRQANSTTFCGSLAYCAPEILQRTPYNPWKTDVWSLGVVLYKMVVGGMPFGEGNDLGSVRRISRAQAKALEFPSFPRTSTECQELIKSLLTVESDRRITLLDIARSRWMNNMALRYPSVARQGGPLPVKSKERRVGRTLHAGSPFADNFSGDSNTPAVATPSVLSRLRMRMPTMTFQNRRYHSFK